MLKKSRQILKCQNGFTLIELMAVVAIIGILAAIAVPRFASATLNAQAAKIAADLRTIDGAVAMYVAENGTMTAPTLTNAAAGSADADSNLVPAYLQAVPLPPVGTYALGADFGATWTNGANGVIRTSASLVETIRGDLN